MFMMFFFFKSQFSDVFSQLDSLRLIRWVLGRQLACWLTSTTISSLAAKAKASVSKSCRVDALTRKSD